jgi:hypothetical protein
VGGQKFRDDVEEKNKVTTWLCEQAVKFCDIGIQKLIPKLHKYLGK